MVVSKMETTTPYGAIVGKESYTSVATIKKFFIVQYDGWNIANMYEKSYFDTLCQNDLLFLLSNIRIQPCKSLQ